jgi:hypothetical protein
MLGYAPLAITLVAIFAGILVNKNDLKELKADLGSRFDRMEAKQYRMQADLSKFHRVLGQHDKAIEILEKRK